MPHKTVNITKDKFLTWADALNDAKQQLSDARKRVRELAHAVKVCEKRVEKCEPFPGQTA